VDETLLRSWWMPALRGAIAVAFGLLALLCPWLSHAWQVTCFSAYAVLGGMVWSAGALHNRRADQRWRLPLLLGGIGIGVGVLALTRPAPTSLVLVLLIASHALVCGLLDLAAALRLRKSIRGERLLAGTALTSIAFGSAVFASPNTGALALSWLVGSYALLTGALLLALARRVRAWAQMHVARSSPAAGAALYAGRG
jgi:uncharacterized membrane protein HdeD (DUF308 family)